MEGSLAAAFGELDNPNRAASWTFSVAKNGDVYQHVDTDNIAWTNGSRNANKKFWGIEHEGKAGEPLTPAQEFATTCLMEWLLSEHGLTPQRHLTLWEHNEMTAYGAAATACPSGRIPWNTIIPAIEEDQEDDMFGDKDRDKLKDIHEWMEWQRNIAGLEQRFIVTEAGHWYAVYFDLKAGTVSRHYIPNERTFALLGGNPDASDIVKITEAEKAKYPEGAPVPSVK